MTQLTITVKQRYTKAGQKKNGEPYTLTRLLATDSNYYETFKPVAQAIKEGSKVELLCEPTDHANHFSITKVQTFTDPHTVPVNHPTVSGGQPARPPDETPSIEVSKRLDTAVSILCKRFNLQPQEVNPDSIVLGEILRQLYGQRWLHKEMRQ